MMGTLNCIYETPCGWCSKWDKKCDKIAGKTQLISNIDKFVYMANCDHEWEICTAANSSAGRIYRCRKCGATKTEPYNTIDITLSSTPVDKTCDHASAKTNSWA